MTLVDCKILVKMDFVIERVLYDEVRSKYNTNNVKITVKDDQYTKIQNRIRIRCVGARCLSTQPFSQ